MDGLHLTADLRGCEPEQALMTRIDALRALCLAVVRDAGLQAVGELFHRFTPAPTRPGAAPAPSGITGVVLLAESHLAVHTWPEQGAATLDVYVCNFGADNTARAHQVLDALTAAFAPHSVERHVLRRGDVAVGADCP